MPDDTPGKPIHAPIQLDPESKILFFIAASGTSIDDWVLFALSVETGEVKDLVERAWGVFVPSGHLIYAQKGCLMAAPLDTKTLQIKGPAFDMTEKRMATDEMVPKCTFSRDGKLLYVPVEGWQRSNRELVWVDFEGHEELLGTRPMMYKRVCVSGDGAHPKVATELFGDPSIWIYDVAGDNPIRPLIFSFKANYGYPVWRPPDNHEIIFVTYVSGRPQLYRKAADGSGETEALLINTSGVTYLLPHACTPDGNVLLAVAFGSAESPTPDIVAIHLERNGQIEPLLASDDFETHPVLSPDGRWLAYVYDEPGGGKIFVTTYPELEGRLPVSTENGLEPVWAPDGKTIYYRDGTSVIAVSVETEGGLRLGQTKRLFDDVYVTGDNCGSYAIHPDGKRFLMMKETEEEAPLTELIVVENWFEELKRRVPTGKD